MVGRGKRAGDKKKKCHKGGRGVEIFDDALRDADGGQGAASF